MWITKLRVLFKAFQSNLPILGFCVTSTSSLHLPSIFFLLLSSFSPLPLKCFPLCLLISNIILITIGKILFVLVCFDLIYIYICMHIYIYIYINYQNNSNKTGKVLIVQKDEHKKIIDILTTSFEQIFLSQQCFTNLLKLNYKKMNLFLLSFK